MGVTTSATHPARAAMAPAASAARLHAFDAVRAIALLAGVALHAAMSFVPGIAHTGWPIDDVSHSRVLAALLYAIHVWRMPAFFLTAGFFARLLVERDGLARFARNRAVRVLVPLVVGWLVLYPITVAVLLWASVGDPPVSVPAAQSRAGGFLPLMHLWFLYLLVLAYVAVIAWRGLVVRSALAMRLRGAADRVMDAATHGGWLAGLLAAPTAIALVATPGWTWWWGVPTPSRLVPTTAAVVAYGSAFVAGWLAQRQPAVLDRWARQCLAHAGLTVLLVAACLVIIGGAAPAAVAPPPGPLATTYAVAYALATWTGALAFLGACLRWAAAASAPWRYLSEASYWIYLVHLPVVFVLQAAVEDLAVDWTVKYPSILLVATAGLLATYHVAVRPTALGAWLNGRRHHRPPSSSTALA